MDDLTLMELMLRSRLFERKVQEKFDQGVFYGTTHLNIGQEASHTGLVAGLDEGDWIVPTHRCHGYNVARGTKTEKMFSELFGSRNGVCRGLGGSMHMTETATCNAGSSAIVGSGVPLAVGLGFALKRKNRNNISVAIFGDGATSRGAVHEAMNLASVWHIPTLFWLENNYYGMSAPVENAVSVKDLSSRADAYSMAHAKVDGNDIHKVIAAVEKARKYIIEEGKPYLLESDTYRMCGHSKSDKRIYRSKEEETEWMKKDPILRFKDLLLKNGTLTEESYDRLYKKVETEIGDSFERAEAAKDDVLTMRELSDYLSAPSPSTYNDTGRRHAGTYRDAIYEALDEILTEDGDAVLIGEDLAKYGGCFQVTKDLWKKHEGKVLETPVSEEGFTTMAVGASMLGVHPIVEIMYADFSTLVSDSLINHAAKTYFMSAGQLHCPMVYRAPIGSGTGHGSQHTANIEAMFLNTPGLTVVAPSDAFTAKALLKSANRSQNPVLFFEHKNLYKESGEIGDENTFLPLGKSFVSGSGKDLLAIGYSHAMQTLRRATESMKDRITYLDLATISPLDKETILDLADGFEKILVVEDTPALGSVGDSVISLISQKKTRAIPPVLIAARDLPIPFSRELERSVIPTEEEVRDRAELLLEL